MSEGAAAVAVPRHRAQALMLLVLAVVVYAADQLSKNWVVEHLPEGRTVPVLGEFLQWHFVRNPGAAFSFATGATWVFTILAAVVLAAVLWQIRRLGSRSWAVFFALLLGGVAGNLTDRLIREPGFPVGHVIDFISTPWMMPAIYNVADIGIVSAMILFVLISLLGLPIDGGPRVRSRERQEDRDDESRPDDAQSEDPQSDDPRSDGSHPDEPSSDEPSSDEPRSDDPRSEGTR
ncbi:signal peptidase II [Leucobacter soli]|uniref:signal peptidase II n=1 Tax=Leucobacter soli TaxID=2812850 RepID=UPI001F426CE4|nr:signal peptidase II [Leucobacter soli]